MRRSFSSSIALISLIALAAVINALQTDASAPAQSALLDAYPPPLPSGTPAYFPIILKDWPPTLTPGGPAPTTTRTPSAFQFTLQPGSPVHLANFANNQGCNWFGVSGQVFDLKNKDISGLIVHIDGPNGLSIDALTGSAQKYGASGYEFTLGVTPVDTTNAYRIQLRDGSAQLLSDSIYFPTYGNCQSNPRNHVIINFLQNH